MPGEAVCRECEAPPQVLAKIEGDEIEKWLEEVSRREVAAPVGEQIRGRERSRLMDPAGVFPPERPAVPTWKSEKIQQFA